jgi:hypothetical protein
MLKLQPLFTVNVNQPIGHMRAAPVRVDGRDAVLIAYCGDYEVDPYTEMFFYAKDTYKFALIDVEGKVLWTRDLGPGVVPGRWFTPFMPYDLDGDGNTEIFFVNNIDAEHPLSIRGRRLDRLDPRTGLTTGQWEWPNAGRRINQNLSWAFREFLAAGQVNGQRILVMAQGTYGVMALHGLNADFSPRWDITIDPSTQGGAKGSHMSVVVDINQDGVDEILWGERCISLDDGRELFCCDRELYRGHSDVVQPVLDPKTGRFFIYTIRESEQKVAPRIAVFDETGRRVWGDVDEGHMDMGWVATFDDDGPVSAAIRIGHKTAGPDGHVHAARDEFAHRVLTGEKIDLGFPTYETMPIDFNGDGYHELVRGLYQGDGAVLDAKGKLITTINGRSALFGKIATRHPGEQVVAWRPDGTVQLLADTNAKDSPRALKRYTHPYYQTAKPLAAVGNNNQALGGV